MLNKKIITPHVSKLLIETAVAIRSFVAQNMMILNLGLSDITPNHNQYSAKILSKERVNIIMNKTSIAHHMSNTRCELRPTDT